MSIRDDGGAVVDGGGAAPNRRAVMLGGVTAGAAGVFVGRSGWQGGAGTRPKTGRGERHGTAGTRPKISAANMQPITVEDDYSVTVLPDSIAPGTPTDDFVRINNAFGMLPTETINMNGTNYTYSVGRVNLGPFSYVGGATAIMKPVTADLVGAGPGTVLQPKTSANGTAAVSCHDLNGGKIGGGFGSYQVAAGTIRDLIIDGSLATGMNSKGLNIGDGWGHKVVRIRIQNFSGPGGIGLYANNQSFWTEKGHFQCTLWNNTTAAQMDANGGQASFEFNDFDFDVFVSATPTPQNGVKFTNGAYLSKGDFRMVGNFITSGTKPSTAALTIAGSGATGTPAAGINSHFSNSRVAIEVESDGGTHAPQTINFVDSLNVLTGCTGTMIFDDGGWQPSTPASGQFQFGGVIIGDSSLTSGNSAPPGWL